jgi:hypothetical protein
MEYSYDRRMSNASAEDDDKLTELQGLIADALKPAQAAVDELDKSTDSDALDEPFKHAKELASDLSAAETCEKARDYMANIRAAKASVGKLEAALKLAKKHANREDDKEALEAIENASDELKEVKRELRDIEAEIDD